MMVSMLLVMVVLIHVVELLEGSEPVGTMSVVSMEVGVATMVRGSTTSMVSMMAMVTKVPPVCVCRLLVIVMVVLVLVRHFVVTASLHGVLVRRFFVNVSGLHVLVRHLVVVHDLFVNMLPDVVELLGDPLVAFVGLMATDLAAGPGTGHCDLFLHVKEPVPRAMMLGIH